MDIKPNFVAQAYANSRAAMKPAPVPTNSSAQTAASLVENFADILRHGEETAKAGMVGKADTLSVVEALAASELAVETAVTVRDRVVEAYQEILRMPV
jgi:flagellar hook-basal body complex protein FliE